MLKLFALMEYVLLTYKGDHMCDPGGISIGVVIDRFSGSFTGEQVDQGPNHRLAKKF